MQNQTTDPLPRDRVQKQRVLAELLGPRGLAAMKARGLDLHAPDATDANASLDEDAMTWQRNRLLQRLRDSGLLADRQNDIGELLPSPVSQDAVGDGLPPVADIAAGMLSTRIAGLIDPDQLANEHPAVIAHILRDQDRALRVSVLKTLPGYRSRAVMRYLQRT